MTEIGKVESVDLFSDIQIIRIRRNFDISSNQLSIGKYIRICGRIFCVRGAKEWPDGVHVDLVVDQTLPEIPKNTSVFTCETQ